MMNQQEMQTIRGKLASLSLSMRDQIKCLNNLIKMIDIVIIRLNIIIIHEILKYIISYNWNILHLKPNLDAFLIKINNYNLKNK